jgi:oxalate decarboxylase/phosphoglucose isomerase-like protein (cupin superfamily)
MKIVDPETRDLLKSKFSFAQLPQYKAELQEFRYSKPEQGDRKKTIARLFTSDLMCGFIQVIKEGGETTLHSHAAMDGLWMVLSGRARFYSEGNAVVGEFGPLEGVYVPRGVKYSFESVADEPLQLLQVEGFARELANEYSNYSNISAEERSARGSTTQYFDARIEQGESQGPGVK